MNMESRTIDYNKGYHDGYQEGFAAGIKAANEFLESHAGQTVLTIPLPSGHSLDQFVQTVSGKAPGSFTPAPSFEPPETCPCHPKTQ